MKSLPNGDPATQIKIFQQANIRIQVDTCVFVLLRYFEKTVFEKSLSGARCRKNVLTWVKTRLKCLPELESSVSPGRNSRGNISLKSGVGVFFYVYLDPCISKTVRYIKMCPGSKFLKFKDLQIRLHTFFRYLKRFLRYFEKTVTVQLSAN